MASSLTGWALATSIERPMYSGPSATGISGLSVESITRIMWLGTTDSVASNQKADIWVSTQPLSGMPLGSTTSKADTRSVATSSRRSPRS